MYSRVGKLLTVAVHEDFAVKYPSSHGGDDVRLLGFPDCLGSRGLIRSVVDGTQAASYGLASRLPLRGA